MRMLAIFTMLASVALSQVVKDATSTFKQVNNPSGLVMQDTLGDQATGQGADDFVVNGVYIKYALVNAQQSQIVRGIFSQNLAKGFGGNFKVAIDANNDGAVDLIYGVSDTGGNAGIIVQTVAPGAVSIGATNIASTYSTTPFSITNYSYSISDIASTYGSVTFAVPFVTIQSALASVGINVTETSYIRSAFFTATNQNSINQDVYGVTGLTNTLRFDNGGGFSELQNFYGNAPVVPEPSTFAQVGCGIVIFCIVGIRRKLSS